MCLNSCLFAPGFPLPSEADPEGEDNQAKVEREGLFADIEENIAQLAAWGGKKNRAVPSVVFMRP